MSFSDWFGLLGTGIQSSFAWIAYNRDGFVDNISLRQNQKYQQKNYEISWIAIARDDIRDMMGISVSRINNYMIVATLILSVAAGAVVSVSFNSNCPAFIVFAFYLSSGISLVFLMLAIMFGVKGQNSAFSNTMKLLTYQVRPENPADYSFDYMKQTEWIEQNGLGALFRIPGIIPVYGRETKEGEARQNTRLAKNQTGKGKKDAGAVAALDKGGGGSSNSTGFSPFESLAQRSSHAWYLTKFAEFMRLWHPYDIYSKWAMGLGIICLCHSSAYFTLGSISVHSYRNGDYAACIIAFSFMFMVSLIIMTNFKHDSMLTRLGSTVLIAMGPALAALASVTEDEVHRQATVPVSFLLHFIFWIAVFCRTLCRDFQDQTVNFVNRGYGFWESADRRIETQKLDDERARLASHVDEEMGFKESSDTTFGKEQKLKESLPVFGDRTSSMGFDASITASCWPIGQRLRRQLERPLNDPFATKELSSAQKERPNSDPGERGWPTDDLEFEQRASETSASIKSTMRNTILCSAGLWLAMFSWAAMSYWVDVDNFGVKRVVYKTSQVQDDLLIRWPNPLFRPIAASCAQGSIFVTDGFRIYSVSESRKAEEIPCPGLEQRIVDLSVSCNEQGCSPLALVNSSSITSFSSVIDCPSGTIQPLLQDDTASEHFDVVQMKSEPRLFATRKQQMVVYSSTSSQWKPEAFLGQLSFLSELGGMDSRPLQDAEGLVALSSVGTNLFFIRRAVPTRAAVELKDAMTMESKGLWQLPTGFPAIQGGCAESNSSLLVLVGKEVGTGSSQLIRLSLS